MSKSVLFYSNKCKHSRKALELIQKNKININLVSIDNPNINLPNFLKVVPTIIEEGQNSPLEGNFVFKWLDRYIKQNQTKENIVKKTPDMPNNDSIQPFFSNEMSGYSDAYSYLNNETPMNHSYEFLNGGQTQNVKDFSNSVNNNSNDKDDEFNKQYEQLMEQRRSEVPDAIKRS